MECRYCLIVFIISHVCVTVTSEGIVKFKRTLSNLTAIEGEMVVLRCQFKNGDGLKRTWTNGTSLIYADEEKYFGGEHVSLEANNPEEYSILLQSVTAYDEGVYTCTIYGNPVKTKLVYLTVNVPAQFTSNISPNVILNEGGKTILTCVATGKPRPVVSWRHLIPSADGVMGTGFRLPLTGITRQNEGIYECTADNKISAPVTRRIRVSVKYPPEMIDYRKVKKTFSAIVGESVTLECSAHGYPAPNFIWKHLEYVYEDRKSSSNVIVLDVPRGNTVRSKLNIQSVSEKDFGEYACIAKNDMGFANGTVTLLQVMPAPTRPDPLVYFRSRGAGGNRDDGSSAKSQFTFSKILTVLSSLLGAKIVYLFGN